MNGKVRIAEQKLIFHSSWKHQLAVVLFFMVGYFIPLMLDNQFIQIC